MDTSKIIKGVVNSGRYTVTAPIIKEDYGLYLQIEGVELPQTYEVDFSNSEHNGTSVTMIGNSDGVLIPHQFIDTGKDIFAFLYHVGANYGRTVYKFRIPNKVRPDRTEEQPTPEEQSVIDQAINALNEAVEQTAQDVIDADASAQSAQGYAEQAEDARDTAQGYASNAQLSATQASNSAISANQSASASANSASQSAQIKADVEDLADDAQGYADSASQSASQASASEQGCARAVLDAASAAAIARARADEASGYAQTASAKAQDASGYAQTASQKATESAQSASQALSYKTDAESAKTASQTAQGLAESARDSAITAKDDAESAKADAESARDEAQSIVDGISGALDDKAPVITDTASGEVASFPDGADGLPLKSLVVNIDPVQDLHGYDSPWVAGGGKNILAPTFYDGIGYNVAVGTVLTLAEATNVTVSGNTYTRTVGNWGGFGMRSPQLATGTYYLMAELASVNMRSSIYVLNSDMSVSRNLGNQGSGTTRSIGMVITLSGDEAYIAFNCLTSSAGNVSISAPMVALSSTATSFAPYENICPISGWTGMQLNVNGTEIPISWQTEAGTVYGGRLDVLSGKLTVYPYYASYNGETLTGKWISDRDVYAVGTTPTIGAQVVNIGAEGTEYQLDPHEIASLLGANNIWADTGDTEVEYRADTKLYIEKLTQPEEDDMIADSNIVSGQYFMVGNSLYKATANIANGGQITVGTNCTRVSLAQALNEINS